MAIISTILESAFNSPTVRTHHGEFRAGMRNGFGDSGQDRRLTNNLAIVSLTFASLSLILTLSTLYWFVKMRKTFRHELIVLLIQSDLIKSVWFVIPSIAHLLQGPIRSDSAFCQIAGFGLALGIEASDIAVLLIAIHLLMTILRLRTGLYRYRHWAYGAYCFFPLLFASLAFVDGTGYEEAGHYCYLRTDKSWARRALSWIPRYVICCSILAIYCFVYFYVRSRLEDYGRRSSGNMNHPHSRDTDDVPPTPRLISHGLLASLPNSRRGSAADQVVAIKHRNRSSLSSISTLQFELHVDEAGEQPVSKGGRPSKQRPAKMNWNWPGFVQPRSSGENGRLMVEDMDDVMSQPLPSPPLPVHSPERLSRASRSENSSASPCSYWHRPVPSECSTVHGNHASHDVPPSSTNTVIQSTYHIDLTLTHILTMLRKGPPRTSNTLPTTRPSSITISPGSIGGDSGVTRNRERARRQLYALFAYPLVYIIVWIFPFLSHVGYDDKTSPDAPQWVLFVSMVSIGVQGAVDCTLFAMREQPWKYAQGGFWTALRARMRFSGSWRDVGFAGRTREEMFHDSQLARRRREQEIADERARRAAHSITQGGAGVEACAGGARAAATRKTGAVEWWDTADLLDGMIDDEELRDDANDDFWAQLYRLNGG